MHPTTWTRALAYTVAAWQINWYVYEGLLGYKHVSGSDGATLEPYLAESMPKVSADGTKLSFKLRDGLKYSDGTAVKASDFKASIERLFKIDSPGVGFFGVDQGRQRTQRLRHDEEGAHQRDRDERLRADDRHHPRSSGGRHPLHPVDAVRFDSSGQHAGKRPVDEGDPLDRPVHDPELRAEPQLHGRS